MCKQTLNYNYVTVFVHVVRRHFCGANEAN